MTASETAQLDRIHAAEAAREPGPAAVQEWAQSADARPSWNVPSVDRQVAIAQETSIETAFRLLSLSSELIGVANGQLWATATLRPDVRDRARALSTDVAALSARLRTLAQRVEALRDGR